MDTPQRQSQPHHCYDDLLFRLFAQNIAHTDAGYESLAPPSMSWMGGYPLAGFEVTIIGRFWVTAEAPAAVAYAYDPFGVIAT